MPGVICYRNPPQDCASLGHLYRSSPNAERTTRPARNEQQASRRSVVPARFRALASTRSFPNHRLGHNKTAVSLPLLLFLTPEVILLVLERLPGLDILHCRSVCKLLKQFIDQSAKLQYIAEANARGLEPLDYTTSARLCVSRLLAHERNWAMFGSIPGAHLRLNRLEPDEALRVSYDSGKLFVSRRSRVSVYTLCGGRSPAVREYDVPEFEVLPGVEVIPFGDCIGFSILGTIYILAMDGSEVVQTLRVPRRGNVDSLQFRGDVVAALFHPECQCTGVILWNWKLGKLIDILHSVHSPTLSFAFLEDDEIALVRTDRSAGSARIDTFVFDSSKATLRSSLALPDTHPTKWYAKAITHAGMNNAPSGSEAMQHDRGVLALDLELRVRAPHDPNTATVNRNLTLLMVVNKRALAETYPDTNSSPVPWVKWSSGRHRILTGVRVADQSPVSGHRVVGIQTGVEPGKVALFDFCRVGVHAVSSVWTAGTGSWGGNRGIGASGGVSVRAALAQRARTLVRASDQKVVRGWFEGMGRQSYQMPYVVSVRRGMVGAQSAMLDGERVIVTMSDEGEGARAVSRVTWFEFSV